MPEKKPFNNYFVTEKDLKYVPPYFRDTPETPSEVDCVTKGVWPKWLNGTFVRYALNEILVFFLFLLFIHKPTQSLTS